MSTSGITSSLLSQIAQSPSALNQFATDLNQLEQDLQSGNLSAAQSDFVTLSEDALSGATSSTESTGASGITASLLSNVASSSSSSSSFVNELNQLGTDLQSGNVSAAQGDMLSLDSTALNASSAAGTTPSTGSSAGASNQAGMMALIKAIVQAMSSGDNSLASSAMQELAAVSPSSVGASYLQSASENLAATPSNASTSNPISQILQNFNTPSVNNSQSLLNLLA